MKNLLFLLLLLITSLATDVAAQTENVNKEKMKALNAWIGKWQGESSMKMGPGEPKKSTVNEKIESKLDGTVLLVEGIGTAMDSNTKQEVIVHHALAVLSYDQQSSQYKFKSYLKDGRSTDAWVNVTGENSFQWGFDVPGRGKMRYSITLDPVKKTWNEIGEFSADGNSWSKFFEMNLTKVE